MSPSKRTVTKPYTAICSSTIMETRIITSTKEVMFCPRLSVGLFKNNLKSSELIILNFLRCVGMVTGSGDSFLVIIGLMVTSQKFPQNPYLSSLVI